MTAKQVKLADQIREIVKAGQAIGLLVSMAQASNLLGYEEATLESWRNKGIGPKFVANESGRFLGYRLEAIETWLREREVGSTAEAKARRTHEPGKKPKQARA